MKNVMGSLRRKMGPVGLSLIAAALTATAFAGVSVAQDDNGKGDGNSAQKRNGDELRGPGALSDKDRAALEEFKQCLEDNGAPAMPDRPDPGSFDPDNPPERPDPPSEEDRAAMEKAFEACKDKAPEGAPMGMPGHGGPGGGPCGPPPGDTPPGTPPNQGDSGDQQSAPLGSSSGSTS